MTNNIRNINTTIPGVPPTPEEIREEIQKIEATLIQVRQAQSWDEYTTVEDQAQIEVLEGKLKATLELLSYIERYGQLPPSLTNNGTQNAPANNVLRELSPGWNGNYEIRQNATSGMAGLAGLVPDGEFEGFVYIQDSGDPANPPRLALQAFQETNQIEAFTVDSHIIYVETYRDADGNERKRWWVGVDHATKLNAEIVVTAHNVTDHGVTLDFHRALRMSEDGTQGGIGLIGSDRDDVIYGSFGDDWIVGNKGNDELYGYGGMDSISGDSSGLLSDADIAAGVTVEQRRAELGLNSTLADGDDIIDGGTGTDVITGDDGIDSVYEVNAEGENHIGTEHTIDNRITPPGRDEWFDRDASRGWEAVTTGLPRGVVEVRPTSEVLDENAELVLTMPDGYEFATAEAQMDGSVHITVGRHVEGRPPETFTIIVRGLLRSRNNPLAPVTVRFRGNNLANIIDFGNLVQDPNLNNNNFIFEGMGENDVVRAPKNALNQHGLSYRDLFNSPNRYRGGDLEGQISHLLPTANDENSGIEARLNPANNNEIIVTREWTDEENTDTSLRDEMRNVQIDPSDFDQVFIVREGENLRVILVRQGLNGAEPEVLHIVFREVQNFLGDEERDLRDMSWLNFGATADFSSGGDADDEDESGGGGMWNGQAIYLTTETVNGQQVAGNTIQGGSGSQDFAFYYEGDVVSGIESEIIADQPSGEPMAGDGEGGQ